MKKRPSSLWTWLKRLVVFGMILGVAGVAALAAAFWHYSRDLPSMKNLSDYRPNLVTRVFASDYQLMGEFFVERRQFVPMTDIPERLIQAFLAIEDTRFYEHPGIDITGILRASIVNFRAQRTVQGASTITQQIAKTFLLSSERTLERKVKEILLAYRIERKFSKNDILELYVNQIYLGAGAYGVGAAARIYFNRDVSELTLGQVALLAGLPKAPSRYDPWRNPEAARQRQKLVLGRMVDARFVTQEEADMAAAASFGLAYPWTPLEQVAPYYLEHVRRTVLDELGQEFTYRGGLDIYTTLDPAMQRAAHAAVREGLIAYDRRHGYRGPLSRRTSVDSAGRTAWLAANRVTTNPAATNPEAETQPVAQPAAGNPYRKALVLKVAADGSKATLLLGDGQEVVLEMEGARWVRKRMNKEKAVGAAISRLTDVIAAGDVVLVEHVPADGRKKAMWRLAQDPDVEGALVAVDPHTGEVVAMVGGYDFARSEFNRATQGQRQPGSSFKPFIYAAALEREFSPISIVDDTPLPIPYREGNQTKVWMPQNYERSFMGPITLRIALEHSRNLVTIRLLKSIGVPEASAWFERFGLSVPAGQRNLTMALGTSGFPPLQMASAYGVLANGGKLIRPVYIARIQDRFGRTVKRHGGGDCLLCHVEPERGMLNQDHQQRTQFASYAVSPQTAYQVTNMLKGVITHGTAQAAKSLNRPLAGKTGTTNDFRDAWFVGYSPSLVAAVWIGHDDNTTLGAKETGGTAALPIWISFMREAMKKQPVTDFPVPPGIHLEAVDPHSGRPPVPGGGRVVLEAFKDGQGPVMSAPEVEPPPIEPGVPVEDDETSIPASIPDSSLSTPATPGIRYGGETAPRNVPARPAASAGAGRSSSGYDEGGLRGGGGLDVGPEY